MEFGFLQKTLLIPWASTVFSFFLLITIQAFNMISEEWIRRDFMRQITINIATVRFNKMCWSDRLTPIFIRITIICHNNVIEWIKRDFMGQITINIATVRFNKMCWSDRLTPVFIRITVISHNNVITQEGTHYLQNKSRKNKCLASISTNYICSVRTSGRLETNIDANLHIMNHKL